MRCSKKATDNKTANKSETGRCCHGLMNQNLIFGSSHRIFVHSSVCGTNCETCRRKHDGLKLFCWILGWWVKQSKGHPGRFEMPSMAFSTWLFWGSSSSRKINKEKTTKPKLKQNYLRNKEQERMLENMSVNKNLEESGCSKTGTLSCYEVSAHKLRHIHTFKTKFSEPVYSGFYLNKNSYMSLCL